MGTGGFIYRGRESHEKKPAAVGLAERIAAISESLTPAERRIAQVLISTQLFSGLETILKLAQRAHVSGPSIIRFTTKLGFDGFAAFQSAVSEDIQRRLNASPDPHSREPTQHGDGLVRRALETFQGAIERTLARVDEALLERVATVLCDVRRPIYFLGGGVTHHLAEMLWAFVLQVRSRAYLLQPSIPGARDQLVDVGRRDILVVFDVRRYLSDTMEICASAKARGAQLILFTDTFLSPIARLANDVLTCDLDAPSPHDSLVACLALVETVGAAVSERTGDAGRRRIAQIKALRDSLDEPDDSLKVASVNFKTDRL